MGTTKSKEHVTFSPNTGFNVPFWTGFEHLESKTEDVPDLEKQLQQSLSNWPGNYKQVRSKADTAKIEAVVDLPEKYEDFRNLANNIPPL